MIADLDLSFLNGKSLLVTGGTGTFGQAFIRYVAEHANPRRLIVFSRDELKQFEMQNIFQGERYKCMRYFLGDVRDQARLETAFSGVDYVVHAAALKQIVAAEYNPFECIQTNVIGAQNISMAAIRSGVQKVVALSTDKAANPINIYGASKLASDKIFVAANNISGGQTQFSVVRYGNVLGSRGSVVPFFKKMIAEGATSLPITHEEMTRFLITVQQGVEFVLSSLITMVGGELFVPKIPSMKIVNMAKALAPNLEHHIIGIRASEKLHEVMVTTDDARHTVEFEDRYIILPEFSSSNCQDHYQQATKVQDGFVYSSNLNNEWLSEDGFLKLIEGT
ncbi:MAG: UDP-N-acetylglucosamine 4,6-dehydratase (inverting) [Terasakiella sp.]|uniref:UDP-N-acetylglucosamine 4,6-dehydratase (inverting) n=1 Tax=unclassified Terasakiella TaxID=2614952 RepID=UPI003B00821E